jgi:hypothetical protein
MLCHPKVQAEENRSVAIDSSAAATPHRCATYLHSILLTLHVRGTVFAYALNHVCKQYQLQTSNAIAGRPSHHFFFVHVNEAPHHRRSGRGDFKQSGGNSRSILGHVRAEPAVHDWTWFFWMSDQDVTVVFLDVGTTKLLHVMVVQLLRLLSRSS